MSIFKSQAGQDRFVYALAVIGEGRRAGTFLDVGCSHPVTLSNTYVLEQVGWKGLLVDREPLEALIQHHRTCSFVRADVLSIAWAETLKQHGMPEVIDYLSFDVDEAGADALPRLPWASTRFRVLTVEHDAYRFGDGPRARMRQVLQQHGYALLCPDVMNEGLPFEDWWVDPSAVDMTVAERFRTTSATEWQKIVDA